MHKRGKPRLSKRNSTPRVTAERDAGLGLSRLRSRKCCLTPGHRTERRCVASHSRPDTEHVFGNVRSAWLRVGRDGLRVLRYAIATAAASPVLLPVPPGWGNQRRESPIREYRGIRSDWSLRGGERVPRGEGARPPPSVVQPVGVTVRQRRVHLYSGCGEMSRTGGLGYSIWSTLLQADLLRRQAARVFPSPPPLRRPEAQTVRLFTAKSTHPCQRRLRTSGEETDGAGPSEAIRSRVEPGSTPATGKARQVRVRDQGWITAAPGRDDR